MKILVTAGATQTPIDQVRAITNIFKGKTGTQIAIELASEGHYVHLLTSNLDLLTPKGLRSPIGFPCALPTPQGKDRGGSLWALGYRTFDDLALVMENQIRGLVSGGCTYDVIIHSAAVSDYKLAPGGVLVPRQTYQDFILDPIDASGKVSGSHDEIYLRLIPTYKIVDKIRTEWGFKGFLVKFKLQVGITDEELINIARKSRETSDADIIVANCLEWAKEYAYVIDRDGNALKVTRGLIGAACLQAMQRIPA